MISIRLHLTKILKLYVEKNKKGQAELLEINAQI